MMYLSSFEMFYVKDSKKNSSGVIYSEAWTRGHPAPLSFLCAVLVQQFHFLLCGCKTKPPCSSSSLQAEDEGGGQCLQVGLIIIMDVKISLIS